jgi:hypothetical protein
MKSKLVIVIISALWTTSGQSWAFDMVRDANAKQFTQKVDHSKDDKRPVTQLKMKRPDNFPVQVQK